VKALRLKVPRRHDLEASLLRRISAVYASRGLQGVQHVQKILFLLECDMGRPDEIDHVWREVMTAFGNARGMFQVGHTRQAQCRRLVIRRLAARQGKVRE
jgi:hypothetical protein